MVTTNRNILLIGLGNPGREYKYTRHNVGFLCIDNLAGQLDIKINRVKSQALMGTGLYKSHKVTLAKPQTFMNLSGTSVSSMIRYFKVELDDVLIIHDDLDLPFGTLRLRAGGSSGGQKGIGSVIDALGTETIPRLRIGIGRPPGKMTAVTYVLQRFNTQEEPVLQEIIERSANACLAFMDHGIERAMNQYNSSNQ